MCVEHRTIAYHTVRVRSMVAVRVRYSNGKRAGLGRKIHKAVAGNNFVCPYGIRYSVKHVCQDVRISNQYFKRYNIQPIYE